MDTLPNILTLLKISHGESSSFFASLIGASNSEMSTLIINWISEKILERYSEFKDDVDVVKFAMISTSLKNIPDMLRRINLYNVISTYDYWNISAVELIDMITGIIEQNSHEHPVQRTETDAMGTYGMAKFLWSIVVQLDIPFCHRRIAAVFLFQYDNTKNLSIKTLKGIINSTANMLEKFYTLSALKFLYTHTNIHVMYGYHIMSNDDLNFLSWYEEQCFSLRGVENEISDEDAHTLKDLGETALVTDHGPFEVKTIYRGTPETTPGGSTSFQKGFSAMSLPDSPPVYLNQCSFYESTYNGKAYMIKQIENVGEGRNFSSVRYSASDYACMLGILCGNDKEILPFYNRSTSTRLIARVGSHLLLKNVDGADIIVFDLIGDMEISIDVRIAIAAGLRNMENTNYARTAHMILKEHFYMMTNTQKQKVNSIIL